MSDLIRLGFGLMTMCVVAILLSLLPSPGLATAPDRFFVGSPSLTTWTTMTAFASATAGGWIGGRWLPLAALVSVMALHFGVFSMLQAIAAPVEAVSMREIAVKNVWALGASLIGTYTGALFGLRLRLVSTAGRSDGG